jgi:hypothetical protein
MMESTAFIILLSAASFGHVSSTNTVNFMRPEYAGDKIWNKGPSQCKCKAPNELTASMPMSDGKYVYTEAIPDTQNGLVPTLFGSFCKSWDQFPPSGLKPFTEYWGCNASATGGVQEWCKDQWCYVDPCDCEPDVATGESLMFTGANLFFSYDLCCMETKTMEGCMFAPGCTWDGIQCRQANASSYTENRCQSKGTDKATCDTYGSCAWHVLNSSTGAGVCKAKTLAERQSAQSCPTSGPDMMVPTMYGSMCTECDDGYPCAYNLAEALAGKAVNYLMNSDESMSQVFDELSERVAFMAASAPFDSTESQRLNGRAMHVNVMEYDTSKIVADGAYPSAIGQTLSAAYTALRWGTATQGTADFNKFKSCVDMGRMLCGDSSWGYVAYVQKVMAYNTNYIVSVPVPKPSHTPDMMCTGMSYMECSEKNAYVLLGHVLNGALSLNYTSATDITAWFQGITGNDLTFGDWSPMIYKADGMADAYPGCSYCVGMTGTNHCQQERHEHRWNGHLPYH